MLRRNVITCTAVSFKIKETKQEDIGQQLPEMGTGILDSSS